MIISEKEKFFLLFHASSALFHETSPAHFSGFWVLFALSFASHSRFLDPSHGLGPALLVLSTFLHGHLFAWAWFFVGFCCFWEANLLDSHFAFVFWNLLSFAASSDFLDAHSLSLAPFLLHGHAFFHVLCFGTPFLGLGHAWAGFLWLFSLELNEFLLVGLLFLLFGFLGLSAFLDFAPEAFGILALASFLGLQSTGSLGLNEHVSHSLAFHGFSGEALSWSL